MESAIKTAIQLLEDLLKCNDPVDPLTRIKIRRVINELRAGLLND